MTTISDSDILSRLRLACLNDAGSTSGGLGISELRALAQALNLPTSGTRATLRKTLCLGLYPDLIVSDEPLQVPQSWQDIQMPQAAQTAQASQAAQVPETVSKSAKGSAITQRHTALVMELASRLSAEKVASNRDEIETFIRNKRPYYSVLKYQFPGRRGPFPKYYGPGQYDPKTGGLPIVSLVKGYTLAAKRQKMRKYPTNVLKELAAMHPDLAFDETHRWTHMDGEYNEIVVVTNPAKWMEVKDRKTTPGRR